MSLNDCHSIAFHIVLSVLVAFGYFDLVLGITNLEDFDLTNIFNKLVSSRIAYSIIIGDSCTHQFSVICIYMCVFVLCVGWNWIIL